MSEPNAAGGPADASAKVSANVAGTAAEPLADGAGLLEGVVDLSHELQALAHDHLQLAGLEAKLAARNLMTMIAAAVSIGILVVTAWLTLMGALVWWLSGAGVAPAIAMLATILLNLLAALTAYAIIRRRSGSLGFPATLRSLRLAASRREEGPTR